MVAARPFAAAFAGAATAVDDADSAAMEDEEADQPTAADEGDGRAADTAAADAECAMLLAPCVAATAATTASIGWIDGIRSSIEWTDRSAAGGGAMVGHTMEHALDGGMAAASG